jgi:D-beta-D-heptose 7-phosphate kinase/D-beta-D-heptose 1-phosphate adenosyltransferase
MTDRSRLVPLVEKISGTRVLVVGDVMLDRFIGGEVARISPEAPIPVLRVTEETHMPGGAGNVVRNLAALGAHVDFIAVIGDDDAGEKVEASLNDLTDVTPQLIRDPDRRTTVKTRYVAGNQQMLRADREATTEVSDSIGAQISDAFQKMISSCDVVVLSDYGKGALANGRAAEFIQVARDNSVDAIVDPKGNDYNAYRGASLVTPNRKELQDVSGVDARTDEEIISAATSVMQDNGLGGILVTRSADGMSLIEADGTVAHRPAESQEVYDVSGAGDTVVATVAALIGAGANRADAAAIANVAAGIVVAKVGTAVAYASELTASLHHQDISDAEAKVLTTGEAADRINVWRRQGLKIGFTNGCFDLLHPGHVSLLSQARAACDKLIVGVNSDASVKRLKGEERPMQNEAARSAVLASLSSVDLVVIFAEDTPYEIIQELRPDIIVKGADYKEEDVVGGDLVKSWGGSIVLAELRAGFSTTATIERIGATSDATDN